MAVFDCCFSYVTKVESDYWAGLSCFISMFAYICVQHCLWIGSGIACIMICISLTVPCSYFLVSWSLLNCFSTDVAIGAPQEDDLKGAVYIYNGRADGITPSFSQVGFFNAKCPIQKNAKFKY